MDRSPLEVKSLLPQVVLQRQQTLARSLVALFEAPARPFQTIAASLRKDVPRHGRAQTALDVATVGAGRPPTREGGL